jgi:uncharacterized protein YecE (DUF72 family)
VGEVRIGTSGWAYPTWVGPFYPEGTSAARMLARYAESFRTVEAHATYRRAPTSAALGKWVAAVPADFRFAPKAHIGITHRRDTDGLADRMAAFYAALAPLGDRLGPVLFVLPHRLPDLDRLDKLLAGLPPAGPPAVFELAPGWWTDEVVERLARRDASLAFVDRDDGPAPEWPPPGGASLAYVRLRRSTYADADLAAWAARLTDAGTAGRDVYAFVKHDEGGDGPRYARDLVKRLERR